VTKPRIVKMKGKIVRWRESPLKVPAVFDVWNITQ
jgi:hypothetical protein